MFAKSQPAEAPSTCIVVSKLSITSKPRPNPKYGATGKALCTAIVAYPACLNSVARVGTSSGIRKPLPA